MKPLIFNTDHTTCTREEIKNVALLLEDYRAHLKEVVEKGGVSEIEAFINTPSETEALTLVKEVVARFKAHPPKFVVVVGIGGSNLGAQTIYEAVGGAYVSISKDVHPKLFFLDTIDQGKIAVLKKLFETEATEPHDVVINVISKSGTTAETIVNAEVLYASASEVLGDMRGQVVVTTDEGSALWNLAESYEFLKLPIPKKVGGRFSVFSPVGLFPLALAGISIDELLEGARSMRDICLENVDINPALETASVLHLLHTKGIVAHNSFFFSPQMESVGKWYRQLMGESLGKEHDMAGNVVHEGIVPLVSIGSTDLHSMAQLYFGGPRVFFTTLITVKDETPDTSLKDPAELVFSKLVEDIDDKSQYEVMQSLSGGVEATYANLSLPHMSIVFPEISAYTLGQYLQYNMMTIVYLAKLMKVNAFDQPSVEVYKIETRRLLKGG